jgi:hypothetical protein
MHLDVNVYVTLFVNNSLMRMEKYTDSEDLKIPVTLIYLERNLTIGQCGRTCWESKEKRTVESWKFRMKKWKHM